MSCHRPFQLGIGYRFSYLVNLKIIFVIPGANDFWKKKNPTRAATFRGLIYIDSEVAVRTTLTNTISACTGKS